MNNTRQNSILYVKVLTCADAPRLEILYNNTKEIRIYLPYASYEIFRYRSKTLINDFIRVAEGYSIPSLESSNNINRRIVQFFINICNQIHEGVSSAFIRDEQGNSIINTTHATNNTTHATNNIAHATNNTTHATNNTTHATNITDLFRNLGGSIINQTLSNLMRSD